MPDLEGLVDGGEEVFGQLGGEGADAVQVGGRGVWGEAAEEVAGGRGLVRGGMGREGGWGWGGKRYRALSNWLSAAILEVLDSEKREVELRGNGSCEFYRVGCLKGMDFEKHIHVLFGLAKGLTEANSIAFEENLFDHGKAIQGYLHPHAYSKCSITPNHAQHTDYDTTCRRQSPFIAIILKYPSCLPPHRCITRSRLV